MYTILFFLMLLSILSNSVNCSEDSLGLDDNDGILYESRPMPLEKFVDVEQNENDQQQQQNVMSFVPLRPDYAFSRFMSLVNSMFDSPEKRRTREAEPSLNHPILRAHRLFVNFGRFRG